MRFPRLAALPLAVLTTLALMLVVAPANAKNPQTPGNITGYGFDQCLAPTQWQMDRWMDRSPFLAVGIYISGKSRGCRDQPNLTPAWVHPVRKGWRLLPITLGPQASCHPSFPRYGNDPTINNNPGAKGNYPQAQTQARNEASNAVSVAKRLGIVPGSTLWYDLEGFDISNTRCRESALRFLSAWTTRLHKLGYVSGVYSSAGSGMKMLDDARVNRPKAFDLPDQIWIARWDGKANTSTSYLRDGGWRPGGRMKQYRGGHKETWGGVTINIDSNYLDLGRGSVSVAENHCNGVRVNWRRYRFLKPGTNHTAQVKSLKCLLKEQGYFTTGDMNGVYGSGLHQAVRAWQKDSGLKPNYFRIPHWQRLVVQGRWQTLKTGSASRFVRKAQRGLNASGYNIPVSGVYDGRTKSAVTSYQRKHNLAATGIAGAQVWNALRRGVR